MASELTVQTLKGPLSGPNANKILIANGHTIEGVGGLIQVEQARKTDTTFSTSSTSLTDITGLSVTVTPQSVDSKFLVSVSLSVGAYWWNTAGGEFGVKRDSTLVAGHTGNRWGYTFGPDATNSQYEVMQWSEEVLDSPSTTSSVTYKAQISSQVSGTPIYINRAYINSNKKGNSWITVWEIAG